MHGCIYLSLCKQCLFKNNVYPFMTYTQALNIHLTFFSGGTPSGNMFEQSFTGFPSNDGFFSSSFFSGDPFASSG